MQYSVVNCVECVLFGDIDYVDCNFAAAACNGDFCYKIAGYMGDTYLEEKGCNPFTTLGPEADPFQMTMGTGAGPVGNGCYEVQQDIQVCDQTPFHKRTGVNTNAGRNGAGECYSESVGWVAH